MNTKTWRVVPTSKAGTQAPYFFVTTTEGNQKKAEVQANKLARQRTALSKYDNWDMVVSEK